MTGRTEYWEECIACTLDEMGIPNRLSREEIKELAQGIEGGYENMNLSYPVPDSPLIGEVADLKRKLKIEESKVVCWDCRGKGYTVLYGGTLQSTSQCWKCHGEGYLVP